MVATWNESLKIGIPEIDKQHQQLLDCMDSLVEAMRKNQGQEEIEKIIAFLDQYIQEHFGFEEKCMYSYCCPIAGKNQQAHAQFVQNFQQIKQEWQKTGATLSLVLNINTNLLDWFINHIKKIDVQLAPCVPS